MRAYVVAVSGEDCTVIRVFESEELDLENVKEVGDRVASYLERCWEEYQSPRYDVFNVTADNVEEAKEALAEHGIWDWGSLEVEAIN